MSVTLKPHTKNTTFIIEQSDTQNFSLLSRNKNWLTMWYERETKESRNQQRTELQLLSKNR